LSEDDRWRDNEPPARGPSTPPTLQFDPLATGMGVFVAVTIPIVVVGFGQSGASLEIGVVAILIGLAAGLIAGLWVAHRGGRVWRGPQL
jgi:trimethylamine:corrinoid methyltransferase-like protein